MQKFIEPWSFTMKVYYIKNMFVQSSHNMKTGRSEMIENNTWKEYINFSLVSFLCPVIILGTYLESPKYILTFPFWLFFISESKSSIQDLYLLMSWYKNDSIVLPDKWNRTAICNWKSFWNIISMLAN